MSEPFAFDARQSDVIQYGDKAGPLDTCEFTMAIAYNISGGSDRGLNVTETEVAACLGTKPQEPGETTQNSITAIAFDAYNQASSDVTHPLRVGLGDGSGDEIPVAFTASEQANGFAWERDHAPTLNAQIPNDTSNIQTGVRIGMHVRRLLPVECERLQGFPDGWTDITYRGKPAADGPRYKALGNSMAVNVMAWIGKRIDEVSK